MLPLQMLLEMAALELHLIFLELVLLMLVEAAGAQVQLALRALAE